MWLPEQVADLAKTLMRIHGIGQAQLAAKLGVSQSRVSRMLSGKENLTLVKTAQIFSALGRSVRLDVREEFTDQLDSVVDTDSDGD